MAKIKQPYQCDECGKLREKDANHWWLLWVDRRMDGTAYLAIATWALNLADYEEAKHLCGQECAQKLFELWMQTGSLEPPSSKPISPDAVRVAPRKEVPHG